MSEETPRARILIIDDDDAIRSMLSDWLSEMYETDTAEDGFKGLEKLAGSKFDLVISDINMPGINGFETVRRIRSEFPGVKTALITDYDVDTYIRMALEEDVTNIIVKTSPFNVQELFWTVENLLDQSRVFGLSNYLDEETTVTEIRIRSSREMDEVRETMLKHIEETELYRKRGNNLRMIFEEVVSNAIYHAHGREKTGEVFLKEDEEVHVCFGRDEDKFGFSVTDRTGGLSKEKVLKTILRAMSQEGIFDLSGRGLFLSRNFSDRILINIEPGKRTETIVLNHFHDNYKVNKPLYINEVSSST
jgi:DNA-binding response OmpR family regulator